MSAEATLRAMASNYAGGHRWDHLDGDAVLKAADEIALLRQGVACPEDVADLVRDLVALAVLDGQHLGRWEDRRTPEQTQAAFKASVDGRTAQILAAFRLPPK